jgi:hypothetical protein
MAEDGEFPKEFGEMVPWGDAAWYRGYNSPYYKKTHHDWRVKVRDFVEDAIVGNVKEWDENKSIPKYVCCCCSLFVRVFVHLTDTCVAFLFLSLSHMKQGDLPKDVSSWFDACCRGQSLACGVRW